VASRWTRLRRLQAQLGSAGSVTEALFDAGFNASSRFCESGAGHAVYVSLNNQAEGSAPLSAQALAAETLQWV
jgi:methylphosphotriester-DNA--protein-cysteine methyltransferase